MKNETIIIKSVRKDMSGFQSIAGKWYNNITKKFNVGVGDEVEITIDNGGFLQETRIIKKGNPMIKFPKFQKKEDPREKIVSVCLSYAKDLACAGKIELDQIEKQTKDFLSIMERLK